MKLFNVLLMIFPLLSTADTNNIKIEKQRPADFVDIKQIIPEIQIDMRYFSEHNFVGRRIQGYQAPICLLTVPAAEALKTVVTKLLPMGLTLKVYDCYRPQTAVDDFVKWASESGNVLMRTEFYPSVEKNKLFSEGYIARRSGHSRGSTLDLTIVPINSTIPFYDKKNQQVSCTAPKSQRSPDNSLDFGTGFDCFSPLSHPDSQNISAQSKANRLLLRSLMVAAGFKPLDTEWWHFTFVNEPYLTTYFDFPVQ